MVTTFPPSCATFMAVEHIIHLQSVIPSPAVLAQFLYHNFFSFLFSYSLSFTSIKSTLYLLRTEHKNMWPLTRIFAPQPVVFFFFFLSSSTEIFFFPPLTFSWNDTFPRGRFSSVAVCGCLSCWNTDLFLHVVIYSAARTTPSISLS